MILPELHLVVWLLTAHFLGDFTFQPRYWVDEKRRRKWRSPYLYYHVLVHFLLALTIIFWLTGQWSGLGALCALVIALGHFILDLSKIYYVKYIEKEWHDVGLQRGLAFLWDQIGHFCILYLIALWLQNSMWVATTPDLMTQVLIVGLGYYFVMYPTASLVDLSTQDWQSDIEAHHTDEGLPLAGRAIGQLERILALTFILIGQYTALGFLIGAKSIFRFGDLSRGLHHKKTEYILIGTLLSFTVVVMVGLIVSYFLHIPD